MGWYRDWLDRQESSSMGFRFYDDGTCTFHGYGRAKVLEVAFLDGRSRKSGLGRLATGILTQGANIMLASPYHGMASVTVVTETWAHTMRSKNADELQRLYGLALQARVRADQA